MNTLKVLEPSAGRAVITVESRVETPAYPGDGDRAWVKDRSVVVDLTPLGPPVTLRWRKHRWYCPRWWCRIVDA